jgi:hypothetical protein
MDVPGVDDVIAAPQRASPPHAVVAGQQHVWQQQSQQLPLLPSSHDIVKQFIDARSCARSLTEQQWSSMVEAALEQQQVLVPNQWAHLAYTCAKLRRPESQLLGAALHYTEPQLEQLSPAGAANLLWAVAVLQLRPRAAYLAMFCDIASSKVDSMNPHQLSTFLWALGRMRYQPSLDVLKTLLSCMQQRMGGLGPSEFTNISWALGRLQYRPSKAWLTTFYSSSRPLLASSNIHHLASVLAGLAGIRSTPPGYWMAAYLAAVRQQLHTAAPRQVGIVLCALAKRRVLLSPFMVDQLLEQFCHQLKHATSADVAAVIWALPLLAFPHSRELGQRQQQRLLQLASHVLPHMGALTCGQLVQLLSGYARLRVSPGVHWLKVHENACAAQAGCFQGSNKQRLHAARRSMLQWT